jgi:hypothetical protein
MKLPAAIRIILLLFGFSLRAVADDSLDFLIGEWDIFNAAGKGSGTTKVEAALPGAALTEVRRGLDGRELKLWYFYSETDKAWKSVFAGPNGTMRELRVTERLPDGSIRMLGRFPNATGPASLSRFTYYKQADGSVRRHLETSTDDGATWKTIVDATYRKKP